MKNHTSLAKKTKPKSTKRQKPTPREAQETAKARGGAAAPQNRGRLARQRQRKKKKKAMATSAATMRKAARAYIRRGWSVIPTRGMPPGAKETAEEIENSKKPALTKWKPYQGRHATDREIEKWWPDGSHRGIAIVTGTISRLVAVDFDADPDATREQLGGKLGIDWPTTRVHTTRRGTHDLFRTKKAIPNSTKAIADETDVRGEGGYIIAAPTPGYGVESDCEPAVLPAQLASWMRVAKPKKKSIPREKRRTLADAVGAVEQAREGERNDTLYRSAFFVGTLVRDRKVDETVACKRLRRAARKVGLEKEETLATIRSGIEAGKRAVKERRLTHAGNGERLIDHYGDDLRFLVGESGDARKGLWVMWTKNHWKVGGNIIKKVVASARRLEKEGKALMGEAEELFAEARKAKETRCTSLQGIARKKGKPEADLTASEENIYAKYQAARVKLAFAHESENAKGIYGTLLTAPADVRIHVTMDALDADLMLLGVKNGVVDLRTGGLLPHNREFMITRLARASYDPDATAPRFEQFLREVFCDDEELIAYMQAYLGYCCTGMISEKDFHIWQAGGDNGKSTLLSIVAYVLGEYAQVGAPELLLKKLGANHPTERAELQGRRFVSVDEIPEGRQLDEAFIKMITGGTRVRAHFMRKDNFEFQPQAKVVLAANPKPLVRDNSDAFWGRARLVPFPRQFTEDEKDRTLIQKLKAEADGILAWLVQGAKKWYKQRRRGLRIPKCVRRATRKYRQEQDSFGAFLKASVRKLDDPSEGWVLRPELYQRYKMWCDENKEWARTGTAFFRTLEERWGPPTKRRGDYGWSGYQLRNAEPRSIWPTAQGAIPKVRAKKSRVGKPKPATNENNRGRKAKRGSKKTKPEIKPEGRFAKIEQVSVGPTWSRSSRSPKRRRRRRR